MAENKLDILLHDLNVVISTIDNLKRTGLHKPSTRNKLLDLERVKFKFATRLVTFGRKYPIVRVTIKNIATGELEYAFFTDISTSDAMQYVSTELGLDNPVIKEAVIAENIKLGLQKSIANKD